MIVGSEESLCTTLCVKKVFIHNDLVWFYDTSTILGY